MFDLRKELASLVRLGDVVLNPKRWLAEEVAYLALRIPHLDLRLSHHSLRS